MPSKTDMAKSLQPGAPFIVHQGERMRSFMLVPGLLVPLLLTGCVVGPDFARPRTEVPSDWSGPMAPDVNIDQADIAEWWKQFHDPVLDTLVDTALNANRDLEIAEARVREVRAFRGIVAEDRSPRA